MTGRYHTAVLVVKKIYDGLGKVMMSVAPENNIVERTEHGERTNGEQRIGGNQMSERRIGVQRVERTADGRTTDWAMNC